jgi:hypothetical protein
LASAAQTVRPAVSAAPSDLVTVDISPMMRDEIDMWLHERPADRLSVELREALRRSQDGPVAMSRSTLDWLVERTRSAVHTITSDRWLSRDPTVQYGLVALRHFLKQAAESAAS